MTIAREPREPRDRGVLNDASIGALLRVGTNCVIWLVVMLFAVRLVHSRAEVVTLVGRAAGLECARLHGVDYITVNVQLDTGAPWQGSVHTIPRCDFWKKIWRSGARVIVAASTSGVIDEIRISGERYDLRQDDSVFYLGTAVVLAAPAAGLIYVTRRVYRNDLKGARQYIVYIVAILAQRMKRRNE